MPRGSHTSNGVRRPARWPRPLDGPLLGGTPSIDDERPAGTRVAVAWRQIAPTANRRDAARGLAPVEPTRGPWPRN